MPGVYNSPPFAGTVGKELDQVLVGGAEQVGKLEAVVDQDEAWVVEVVEQVFPPLVVDPGPVTGGVEVDVAL